MLPTVATAFGAFPLFNWNGGGCRLAAVAAARCLAGPAPARPGSRTASASGSPAIWVTSAPTAPLSG
jgi:hypothetical protein